MRTAVVLYLRNWVILTLQAPAAQNGQTLKQFVSKLPTNCLSVFDHFVQLALKGLKLL